MGAFDWAEWWCRLCEHSHVNSNIERYHQIGRTLKVTHFVGEGLHSLECAAIQLAALASAVYQ